MSYYVQSDPQGKPVGVWKIDEREAIRLGVSNARNGAGTFFCAVGEEDIWSAIQRGASAWFDPKFPHQFHMTELEPGQYYPRMARTIDQHPFDSVAIYPPVTEDAHALAAGASQFSVLARLLERVFETVYPIENNFGAFGHDIRNILVLACMEVEAHWRGILKANGCTDERSNTNDYYSLAAPMRLAEFSVQMSGRPWLPPIYPFSGWQTSASPSQSLAWYGAYNATKHDREMAFAKATLERAVEAMGACLVMLVAQFGSPDVFRQLGRSGEQFRITARPRWQPSEVYIFPYQEGGWHAKNYPFSTRKS